MSQRLETLMGGKAQLEAAKRAAIKLRCIHLYGNHVWQVVGAEKGCMLVMQCANCGTKLKERL